MSIASEISRLSSNISDSLDAVAAKGVTVPSDSNSDDLPGLIALIEQGSGGDSGGTIYQDLDGYLHPSEDSKNVISIVDTLDTAGGTIRTITSKVDSGGTNTLISSGSWTGTGGYKATIPIGKKMPQTDFLFEMILNPEVILPYDSNYKTVQVVISAYRNLGSFDLSTDGTKNPTPRYQYQAYDSSEAITIKNQPIGVFASALYFINDAFGYIDFQSQRVQVIKDSTGFSLFVNCANAKCPFLNGETFYWNLYYFGNDPLNAIVEVS